MARNWLRQDVKVDDLVYYGARAGDSSATKIGRVIKITPKGKATVNWICGPGSIIVWDETARGGQGDGVWMGGIPHKYDGTSYGQGNSTMEPDRLFVITNPGDLLSRLERLTKALAEVPMYTPSPTVLKSGYQQKYRPMPIKKDVEYVIAAFDAGNL